MDQISTSISNIDPHFDDILYIILSVFGLYTIIFSSIGRFIKEQLSISEPLLATVVGILIGPAVTNWLKIQHWAEPQHVYIYVEIARLTLAIQVTTTSLELPQGYVIKHWKSLLFLLLPVMFSSWAIISLLCWAFAHKYFTIVECALIGASLTPTDPVLAHSVVKGPLAKVNVPKWLKHILSAESGINDGLGLLYYGVPLIVLELITFEKWNTGKFFLELLLGICLYEIVSETVVGIVLGFLAAKLLSFSVKKKFVERDSLIAYIFALSMSVIGLCYLFGMSGILGCFIAGITAAQAEKRWEVRKELKLQESTDLMVGNIFFIIFGATLPLWRWHYELYILFGFPIAILLLKRTIPILLFYKCIPTIKTFREALFMGWNGPMGVGAIFYGLLAIDTFKTEQSKIYFDFISLGVFSSVIVHGLLTVPSTWIIGEESRRKSPDPDDRLPLKDLNDKTIEAEVEGIRPYWLFYALKRAEESKLSDSSDEDI